MFAPPVAELYPTYPPATTVHVEGLTDALCGASRPGHFDGVTTIVAKLFSIVGPARAYFGRKDAQQLAVVSRMAADLELPTEVIGCPLVREPDGLAMSSRNAYLDAEHRAVAPAIFAALRRAAAAVVDGERSAGAVAAMITDDLAAVPLLRVDYVEVRDAATIAAIDRLDGAVLVAVAVALMHDSPAAQGAVLLQVPHSATGWMTPPGHLGLPSQSGSWQSTLPSPSSSWWSLSCSVSCCWSCWCSG